MVDAVILTTGAAVVFALGAFLGLRLAPVPPPPTPCRFERCPTPEPVVIPEPVPLLLDAYQVPEVMPDDKWDVCVLTDERGMSVRRVKAPAPTMIFRERGRKPPVKFVQTGKDADGRLMFEVARGEN